VVPPDPADVATLGLVHTLGYIDAVRRASLTGFPFSVGHGLGTVDDPTFPGHADQRGADRRRVGGRRTADRHR
jgi:hypothetical protein